MARATALLEERYPVLARSRIYESTAVGDPDGPLFFNRAVMIRSALGGAALRAELRSLEAALGRVRTSDRNAPRIIDIDLLLAVDAAGAVLADPPPAGELRHHYAALPAAEIAGDLVLPGEGLTLAAAARALGPPPRGFRTEPDPNYQTSPAPVPNPTRIT